MVHYQVTSLKNLVIIIEHFNKYPLLSDKSADFNLFKEAFNLVSSKAHLTQEGLIKLLSLKASLNRGGAFRFHYGNFPEHRASRENSYIKSL